MASRKMMIGLVLTILAVIFIGIPFTTMLSGVSSTEDMGGSNYEPAIGYRINFQRGFSPLIKLDVSVMNLQNGLVIQLAVYDSEGNNERVGGSATVSGGKATLSFIELGGQATPIGLAKPDYYITVTGGGVTSNLTTGDVEYTVTPIITWLLAPLFLIIGLTLLFMGRGEGEPRARRSRGRAQVTFGEDAPEPVLGAGRKPAKRKKKKKKKGTRPKAKAVGVPQVKASRCPSCGAVVPAGQMYCPSCYAKV